MTLFNSKITELLDKLALRLKAVNDAESLAVVEDIQSLRRAEELLNSNGYSVQMTKVPHHGVDAGVDGVLHAPNGNSVLIQAKYNGSVLYHQNRSKADLAIDIIRKEGKPLHINFIHAKLAEHGVTVKKNTLVTLLGKDRRRRFVRTAPNTFDIDEDAVAVAITSRFESLRGGFSRLFPDNFSLIESVKELASEMKSDFTQPTMVEALRERHPAVADLIQPASVSTILSILLRREYLDITVEGKGPIPRRFRATKKLVAEMNEPKVRPSNSLIFAN